jgi:hypothetical protein
VSSQDACTAPVTAAEPRRQTGCRQHLALACPALACPALQPRLTLYSAGRVCSLQRSRMPATLTSTVVRARWSYSVRHSPCLSLSTPPARRLMAGSRGGPPPPPPAPLPATLLVDCRAASLKGVGSARLLALAAALGWAVPAAGGSSSGSSRPPPCRGWPRSLGGMLDQLSSRGKN